MKNKKETVQEKPSIDAFEQARQDALVNYPVFLKIEASTSNVGAFHYEVRYSIKFRISVEINWRGFYKSSHITFDRTEWSMPDHDFYISYLKKKYEHITQEQFEKATGLILDLFLAMDIKTEEK